MLTFKNTFTHDRNNIIIYTPLSYFADNRQKKYRSTIINTILVTFTFIHRANIRLEPIIRQYTIP